MPRTPASDRLHTLADPERGVAVWPSEDGGFEAGSLDDYVRSRREHHRRNPNDPEAGRALARAYLWSCDAERALDTLAPLHRRRPGDQEVQSLILDALALLGRSADDYPWIERPTVVHLDRTLLDRLYERLSHSRRPATVLDLFLAAAEEGHPSFDAADLLRSLARDRRFLVHRSDLAPECAVVMARMTLL